MTSLSYKKSNLLSNHDSKDTSIKIIDLTTKDDQRVMSRTISKEYPGFTAKKIACDKNFQVEREIRPAAIKYRRLKWTERDDQELVALSIFQLNYTENSLRVMKTYDKMKKMAIYMLKDVPTSRQALQRLKVLSHPKKQQYLEKLCERSVKKSYKIAAYQLRISVLENKDIKRWDLTSGVAFVNDVPEYAYHKMNVASRIKENGNFRKCIIRAKRQI